MAFDLSPAEPRVLAHAPEELTETRLRRVGEGIGKVVYASENWVIARDRSPAEVVSLIVLWKAIRKVERILPGKLGARLLAKPSNQIRLLRMAVRSAMLVIPKGLWFTAHIRDLWRLHLRRDLRGERLAEAHLTGSPLIPERITFPPARVKILGWPGWLTVSEASERVEGTLHQKLTELSRAGRFEEIEQWLNRFLDTRQQGWRTGLFSLDAHLKNFGISGRRIVLLDTGGLTNSWAEVERHLAAEEGITLPHLPMGLGPILSARPDIAERFNARWKAIVNRSVVKDCWPG